MVKFKDVLKYVKSLQGQEWNIAIAVDSEDKIVKTREAFLEFCKKIWDNTEDKDEVVYIVTGPDGRQLLSICGCGKTGILMASLISQLPQMLEKAGMFDTSNSDVHKAKCCKYCKYRRLLNEVEFLKNGFAIMCDLRGRGVKDFDVCGSFEGGQHV